MPNSIIISYDAKQSVHKVYLNKDDSESACLWYTTWQRGCYIAHAHCESRVLWAGITELS